MGSLPDKLPILDEITVVLRQYRDGNVDAENHGGKPGTKEASCTRVPEVLAI